MTRDIEVEILVSNFWHLSMSPELSGKRWLFFNVYQHYSISTELNFKIWKSHISLDVDLLYSIGYNLVCLKSISWMLYQKKVCLDYLKKKLKKKKKNYVTSLLRHTYFSMITFISLLDYCIEVKKNENIKTSIHLKYETEINL